MKQIMPQSVAQRAVGSSLCGKRIHSVSPAGAMPVWQNINLKQKAIFEIIQRPHARDLPYYLTDAELDFFVKGIAWGPHKETYLPRLVERHKRPICIARGYAPPTYLGGQMNHGFLAVDCSFTELHHKKGLWFIYL